MRKGRGAMQKIHYYNKITNEGEDGICIFK
jgi:hypothetical protein